MIDLEHDEMRKARCLLTMVDISIGKGTPEALDQAIEDAQALVLALGRYKHAHLSAPLIGQGDPVHCCDTVQTIPIYQHSPDQPELRRA